MIISLERRLLFLHHWIANTLNSIKKYRLSRIAGYACFRCSTSKVMNADVFGFWGRITSESFSFSSLCVQ